MELTEALLQHAYFSKYSPDAWKDLQAFQALISGIYEDFLRERIKPFAIAALSLAPLAKWGEKRRSPYTLTRGPPEKLIPGVQAGIVSLPAVYRSGGLYAWVSIGHEVAGHNFLQSVPSLLKEMQQCISKHTSLVLNEEGCEDDQIESLAQYWSGCTEEIASDVLGVLSFGAAFALGFLGYLRAERGKWVQCSGFHHTEEGPTSRSALLLTDQKETKKKLLFQLNSNIEIKVSEGDKFGSYCGKDDKIINPPKELTISQYKSSKGKHPIDILRFFVLERVVEKYGDKDDFELLKSEIQQDLAAANDQITLCHLDFSKMPPEESPIKLNVDVMRAVANEIADVVMRHKLKALGEHSITSLIKWSENDELASLGVANSYRKEEASLPHNFIPNFDISSRHIIAGAVKASIDPKYESLHIEKIFALMKGYLASDFDKKEQMRSNVIDK